MLSAPYRFHGYNALRFVYKNGKTVRNHFLTVKYSSNPRRKKPRVAIVVSKKVLKSAVGRNRIRRRLYEQFRLALPHLTDPADIVCIVASAELGTMAADELSDLLIASLKESGLYK